MDNSQRVHSSTECNQIPQLHNFQRETRFFFISNTYAKKKKHQNPGRFFCRLKKAESFYNEIKSVIFYYIVITILKCNQ